MKKLLTLSKPATCLVLLLGVSPESFSQQQYKLRQTTTMSGMKSESTIYVKGPRKRTEAGGFMGMPNNVVTIEQCDKQRTIKLNDKKKLYYIEPFSKNQEEVIDEDLKQAPVKTKPVTPAKTETGGNVHMWYSIVDTGERKKMFGFTARHVWTNQKIKPDPGACMKDSMHIKTDGWYIDLPEFNCPVRYAGGTQYSTPGKPACQDRYITHRSGKGKLGFPLIEKRTMFMSDGRGGQSEFVIDVETLEFSTAQLDSMLFTIPPGYKEVKSESELEDKFDISQYNNNANNNPTNPSEIISQTKTKAGEKAAGMIRIGVFEPKNEASLNGPELQKYLAGILVGGNVESIPVADEEDARQKQCDYTLTTNITRFKQTNKVGGLIKAIKNTDPNAAAQFNIDAEYSLRSLGDGSVKVQENTSGKYEGKPDDATRRAMDHAAPKILAGLK